jgi:hypothetical protein
MIHSLKSDSNPGLIPIIAGLLLFIGFGLFFSFRCYELVALMVNGKEYSGCLLEVQAGVVTKSILFTYEVSGVTYTDEVDVFFTGGITARNKIAILVATGKNFSYLKKLILPNALIYFLCALASFWIAVEGFRRRILNRVSNKKVTPN